VTEETATLLVVDDNEMNRDMLSRRLERKGYKVLLAEDGQQALDMVAAQPFDLILLDIMMPGIDGLEVLRRLREKYTPADLPVIMVTAKDSSEDVVAALKFGANDYVTKPIDFPVVMARTHTQLLLKRAQVELQKKVQEVEVRNTFIRKVFGRYLTDDVVNSLLESPAGLEFGGEKRKVTILMSDLRGFSALSERLGPEKVVAFLNNYLGAMADVITEHQGTIDEFIGDAVLAIFGAPVKREDDAQRAVACALAMQKAMDKVNAWNATQGLGPVEMGVGINTGEVVVGNIGSDRRAKYGVVGSAVNLAGRVESYTVGGQVLITDATASEMRELLKTRRQFQMEAKGMRDPITIHDVTGLGGRFNVHLDEEEDVLHALAEQLAVQCHKLDGKHGSGEQFPATLLRLGKKSAELQGPVPLAVQTNLKLRLTGHPALLEEDLYVKVMDVRTDGGAMVVQFTSVPPGIRSALDGLARAR